MTDIRIEEDDGTPITTAFVYTTDIVHVFGQHNGRFCHHIISAESPSIRRVRGPPSENFDVLTAVYCSRRNVIFTTNTVLNSGAVPFLCKIMEFCCDSGSWREVALVQNVRKIALSMVFKGQYLVMFVKRLHDYLVSVLVFDLVTRRLASIPLKKDMYHAPASIVDDEKSSSSKQTENMCHAPASFVDDEKSSSSKTDGDLPGRLLWSRRGRPRFAADSKGDVHRFFGGSAVVAFI